MKASPACASATILRYRGSKTCSGIDICGNRTTLGSGKRGTRWGSSLTRAAPGLVLMSAAAFAAGLEGVPATARGRRVGVLDGEAAAHQVFFVVHLGAFQVTQAHGVDD